MWVYSGRVADDAAVSCWFFQTQTNVHHNGTFPRIKFALVQSLPSARLINQIDGLSYKIYNLTKRSREKAWCRSLNPQGGVLSRCPCGFSLASSHSLKTRVGGWTCMRECAPPCVRRQLGQSPCDEVVEKIKNRTHWFGKLMVHVWLFGIVFCSSHRGHNYLISVRIVYFFLCPTGVLYEFQRGFGWMIHFLHYLSSCCHPWLRLITSLIVLMLPTCSVSWTNVHSPLRLSEVSCPYKSISLSMFSPKTFFAKQFELSRWAY